MADLALGLDIGTGGARALVVDRGGAVLGEGSATYALHADEPGQAEQWPLDWWSASQRAISVAVQGVDAARIAGVGVSGQMHGAVLIDAGLEPLRRASLWCDGRAAGAVTAAIDGMGRDEILVESGNLPRPGFTGPQLKWLRDSGDTAVGRARWILCAKDFVRAKLTGEVATEHSDASGTGLYSVREGAWSADLAALWQVDMATLPPILESAEVAGGVTPEAAALTGLLAGTPVVAGAADNASSAFGAAIIEEGQLVISVGTSGTLLTPRAEPEADRSGRCHLFRHAVPGLYYSMAVVLNAGGALAWWQSVTGATMDELAQEALAVAPGCDGLIMLPYLSGQRMPDDRPGARAGFIGLSLAHGRGQMTRAAVEGAAFALADGLDCLRAVGVNPDHALITGGASRHDLWLEVLSLTLPSLTFSHTTRAEGAAFGAALLSFHGVGVDLGPLLTDAVQTEEIETSDPDETDLTSVAEALRRFRVLSADSTVVSPD